MDTGHLSSSLDTIALKESSLLRVRIAGNQSRVVLLPSVHLLVTFLVSTGIQLLHPQAKPDLWVHDTDA